MLVDCYAFAEKIDDMFKTLFDTGFKDRTRRLRVGARQEIRCFFKRIDRADTDIRTIQQPGKFHSAEQFTFGFECVSRSYEFVAVLFARRRKAKFLRIEACYFLERFPVPG